MLKNSETKIIVSLNWVLARHTHKLLSNAIEKTQTQSEQQHQQKCSPRPQS